MVVHFKIVDPKLVYLYLWIIATTEGCGPDHVSLCPKKKTGKVAFPESARKHEEHIVATIQKGSSGVAATDVRVSRKKNRH